jgi:hypothetical protein
MEDKERLLQKDNAAIHHLKPSFIGGFRTQEWISLPKASYWVVDYVCFEAILD